MEKEKKTKWIQWIQAIIILVIVMTVLVKIYRNTGLNEKQDLKMEILNEQLKLMVYKDDLAGVNTIQTERIMTLWITTLNASSYSKIQDFFNRGDIWCMKFKDITFVQGLIDDSPWYPGQIMLMKYESPFPEDNEPLDPEKNKRYVALYRNGNTKCFWNIFPDLNETTCDKLCEGAE